MAKVLPGSGIALSGAVSGLVFCRRGNGVYARARVIPRDPKSKEQRARRTAFQAAVAAWRALPEAERESFRKRAARSGRTGYHLFIAEYLVRTEAPSP
ncbi:Hypothetical protein A7982_07293 [Minicystis rosea]|nr:Hypothetical protein A7982_07293 [Minicystis rosea]